MSYENYDLTFQDEIDNVGGGGKQGVGLLKKALAIVLAGGMFLSTGCSNGNNGNEKANSNQDTTELITNQPNFSGIYISDISITGDIQKIMLCEDPETGKVFLSDGDNKLTKDYDDIRDPGVFDNCLYFIGVNDGNPSIMKINGDTIFSGLDEIQYYTIHNGDFAVSGKKNGKTCLIFNGNIIDQGRKYCIFTNNTEDRKNRIYAEATSTKSFHFMGEDVEKGTIFIDGKKVGKDFYSPLRRESALRGGYYDCDYGKNYIVVYEELGPETQEGDQTLLYDGKTIGTHLGNVERITKNSDIISYSKNGKKYILGLDGKEYAVIDMYPRVIENHYDEDNGEEYSTYGLDFDAEDFYLLVNKGNKYYIIDNSGEAHEIEGKHDGLISNPGKTKDGKIYFIEGGDIGQTFVFDGKEIGTLDVITSVGTTNDGTIYLKGYIKEYDDLQTETIYVKCIDGIIRRDYNPKDNSQEWLHIKDIDGDID